MDDMLELESQLVVAQMETQSMPCDAAVSMETASHIAGGSYDSSKKSSTWKKLKKMVNHPKLKEVGMGCNVSAAGLTLRQQAHLTGPPVSNFSSIFNYNKLIIVTAIKNAAACMHVGQLMCWLPQQHAWFAAIQCAPNELKLALATCFRLSTQTICQQRLCKVQSALERPARQGLT